MSPQTLELVFDSNARANSFQVFAGLVLSIFPYPASVCSNYTPYSEYPFLYIKVLFFAEFCSWGVGVKEALTKETGVILTDGTELDADLAIYGTGFAKNYDILDKVGF